MKSKTFITSLIQIAVLVLFLADCFYTKITIYKILMFLALLLNTLIVAFGIIKPLNDLSAHLKTCSSDTANTGQLLSRVPNALPLVVNIKQIIENCTTIMTRFNLAEVFDKQAELAALQSQINPHFLYNTLETIRGQALIDDNVEIAKMVEALASFFRYSISRSGNLVSLSAELTNIQNYMMIQRYRFNNRFSLNIIIEDDVDEIFEHLIPKLSVQPIVENAIFHGLEEKLAGGVITIDAILTDSIFILTISDNGKGMSPQALTELNNNIQNNPVYHDSYSTKKPGIGLSNIHQRIQLLFGKEYGLHVYSSMDQGTDVEIVIPREIKEHDTAYEKGSSENQ